MGGSGAKGDVEDDRVEGSGARDVEDDRVEGIWKGLGIGIL